MSKENELSLQSQPAELWKWSATAQAYGIRTGAISSRELTLASFERIGQVNPKVNALVETSRDEALQMADAADQAVKQGETLSPIHGLNVSIKVNSNQQGHATTHGVVAFKDNVVSDDDPHVANLRKAGAVFVGRGNSPAFSYRWVTNNDLHGRTLNPWDTTRTPGGSSGGAASAVSTGMVSIGHGNDIGGSIRQPAFCCGIAGLRPTVGRIPSWFGAPDQDQPLSVQTMLTQGPLARRVSDLRLALEAMSQFDPREILYAPAPIEGQATRHPIKVGLLRNAHIAKPSKNIDQALNQAAQWLEQAGYVVEEIEDPVFEEAYRLWYLLAMEEFRQIMPLVNDIGDNGMQTAAAHFYSIAEDWWGKNPDMTAYMNGYARRGTLIARLQQFMQSYPLILMPVSAEQAFEQDADIHSLESMRKIVTNNWSMMAVPLLGFPALSVPTGVADGLPVGVQLLGQRYREDMVLDAGEVVEARTGTFTPVDPN